MARRWPQARIAPYLRCAVRRLESLHFYGVGGLGDTESIVYMKTFCFAIRAQSEGAKTERFLLPGKPPGARRGPQNNFSKSEVATKMATSSNRCISTVSRGLIEEGRKDIKKMLLS